MFSQLRFKPQINRSKRNELFCMFVGRGSGKYTFGFVMSPWFRAKHQRKHITTILNKMETTKFLKIISRSEVELS